MGNYGLIILTVFTSIKRGVIEYMTPIRILRDKLLFEREFAGREKEKDIA